MACALNTGVLRFEHQTSERHIHFTVFMEPPVRFSNLDVRRKPVIIGFQIYHRWYKQSQATLLRQHLMMQKGKRHWEEQSYVICQTVCWKSLVPLGPIWGYRLSDKRASERNRRPDNIPHDAVSGATPLRGVVLSLSVKVSSAFGAVMRLWQSGKSEPLFSPRVTWELWCLRPAITERSRVWGSRVIGP